MALATTATQVNEEPAAAVATEPSAASRLLCRSSQQNYAIPLDRVAEIMRVLAVESVAGAPSYVRGLSIIRGAPVPVVDVGRLIGNHETQSGRLVVVKAGDRTVALQVGAVPGVRLLDAGHLSELPPLLRHVASDTVDAIGAVDEELLFALHTTQLVPETVFAAIDHSEAQS